MAVKTADRATAGGSRKVSSKLHCSKCLKLNGDLWCRECKSAFCSLCWGQVLHHDLSQMAPAPNNNNNNSSSGGPELVQAAIDTAAAITSATLASAAASQKPRLGRSATAQQILGGTSPGRQDKSFSKSTLFQAYPGPSMTSPGGTGTGARPGSRGFLQASLSTAKYAANAAAMIPLPDFVVTTHDEYPAPPVFLDGTGAVLEDTLKRRPYTAPVTTQEELHQQQMTNAFKKRSQQQQYQLMMAYRYNSNTLGAPSPIKPGSGNFLDSRPKPVTPGTYGPAGGSAEGGGGGAGRAEVSSSFHYEQPKDKEQQRRSAHSKGSVVVRELQRKSTAGLRPSSPSYRVGQQGGILLSYVAAAYEERDRHSVSPPTRSLSPAKETGTSKNKNKNTSNNANNALDWKTALFAGNETGPSSNTGASAIKASDGNDTYYKVKPL
jgi:hypothetical protein